MRPIPLIVPAAAAAMLVACGGGSSTATTSSSSTAPSSSTTTSSTTTTSAATAAHQAKVVINPTSGKVGSVIAVTGSGYSPNTQVTGTICALTASGAVDNPLTDCDVVNTVTVTTDASGAFTTNFTIKRVPPPKAAYNIGFGVQGDATNAAGAVITITQ